MTPVNKLATVPFQRNEYKIVTIRMLTVVHRVFSGLGKRSQVLDDARRVDGSGETAKRRLERARVGRFVADMTKAYALDHVLAG